MRQGRWGLLSLTLGLFALGPSTGSAQATVLVGGGALLPMADLRTVADVGFQGAVTGTLDLGTTGFAVGAGGFYGRSTHTIVGERSELYGATVLAGYTVAQGYELRLRLWAGGGAVVHARKSDAFPGLDTSKRGLALSGGATVERRLGGVGVFASGLYTRGVGDLGGANYPTDFLTVGGGVAIPIALD